VIVTVTLNAAVDRTLTVPNFQFGHRHRASSSLTSAGGKGVNVARALKGLETPAVATGLAGGRTGERIVEDLALEGILSDFVRISDESRTSIAVVDPTAGALTEVYEWGPAVRPEELEMLLDKLHYLSRVASYVVFCGSLPRDVENDFYAQAIHDLNRRGIRCVLDCEGEPLRLGVEAEILDDPVAGAAAREAGRDHRGLQPLQRPRHVDALAAGAGQAVRCPVPVTELEVRNRQRAVDRGVEGYGDDHCRCTTRGAGYWTRIG
jgi:sugar/nucleoside kinase (ribokinase family)